jgi:glyceraldehyde-3-phosphate dehydrogenase type II
MSNLKTVLVVGTGTIGEPLIGLLARLKDAVGLDRVLFHKRTPLDYEVAKVNSLIDQGAELVVNEMRVDDFKSLGHEVSYTLHQALELASVVIDCTPEGNKNKQRIYQEYANNSDKIFIAQGSEKGFGFPYAFGINDSVMAAATPQFVQVVSCNTHAISRIIKSLNPSLDNDFVSGDFVCIRRANDASQNDGYIPSPTCSKHTDPEFGTHHARDVSDLLETITDVPMSIMSSALKVNSQYMHLVRFSVELKKNISLGEVNERFKSDKFVTVTQHKSANKVFSFGRDHGFYGRIYNHAVICLPSLIVRSRKKSKGATVTGFAFTPQDGNSLLTSAAACLYGIHGQKYTQKIDPILAYLKDEV